MSGEGRPRLPVVDAANLALAIAGTRWHPEITDSLVERATAAAFAWARPLGGVVLLSPAAPSFGQFRDYRDRAEAFARAMRACAAS